VTIQQVRELRRSDRKTTWYLELMKSDKPFEYQSFDAVGLFPENNPQSVTQLATKQNWSLDQKFTLKAIASSPVSAKFPIPVPTTIQAALSQHCDLSGEVL
jgi:sulfite reductase alpha subunit-like flavoprotein